MKKKYLECGKIVTTHGVRGELKVQPWCDTPEFLCGFSTLYLQKGEKAIGVLSAKVHKNMVLLTLCGVESLDEAAALRGKILYIDRDDAPPDPDGGHYIQDLMDIAVIDADTGRDWGNLTNVFSTGANDVYEITDAEGMKRLVPAIADVIIETNPDAGFMKIRPLKGLFDDVEEA